LASHTAGRTGGLLPLLTTLRLPAPRSAFSHTRSAARTDAGAAALRNLRTRGRGRLLRKQRQTAEQKNTNLQHVYIGKTNAKQFGFRSGARVLKSKRMQRPTPGGSTGIRMKEAMAAEGMKDSLRQRGVRLTRQRQILLDLIDKSGQHLDAERLRIRRSTASPYIAR
jgi:hypothetical protein